MSLSGGSFPNTAHYEMLIRGQRALNDVKPLIESAERCGMDCQVYREGHGYLGDQIGAFLREFFADKITPGPPPGVPPSAE